MAGYDNVHPFLHVLPFLLLEQRCILQAGLCLKPWTLPGGVRCNVDYFSISTLQEGSPPILIQARQKPAAIWTLLAVTVLQTKR